MKVELDIWRQNGPDAKGHFEHHVVEDAEPEWSLLELLDRLNDQIVENDGDPIVFESDCREGVCGCCGFMVNGKPHGPLPNTPACRQHLRAFPRITHFKIEPFRSAAFPVIRDLAIDRTSMDHLIQGGGTVDVMTGTALMQIRCRSRMPRPSKLSTSHRVLDAERAWRLVQMARRCFSPARSCRTWR
ncbi:succinate dehydrogenase iron-sulfur protein [Cutibacterium acnes JCM 18920]|nr:succinate dehydrogenase iron-sulfur protein [Cutibacterium acnes JCM 18920]